MVRKYDTGSMVVFNGTQWRVTDFYFDLRNLVSVDNSDEFCRVPVYALDKENDIEPPLPFDDLPLVIGSPQFQRWLDDNGVEWVSGRDLQEQSMNRDDISKLFQKHNQ